MPLFAPLGNAILGETLLGNPPAVSANAVFTITPIGYDGLQVDWTLPTGAWNEQILMRSSFGTPLSPITGDGTVLLDESNASQGFSNQYLDSGLKPGHFYYYSLFVFSTLLDEYILAGSAQGLVITDWGFNQTFVNWIPEWYLEQDQGLSTSSQPNGPLIRFLNLIGYEMDWIRSEIESLYLFTNIELASGALLPYIGANYGMTYEPELGMTRSRVLVKNAVHLYKNRGTADGIAAAGSAFSGYGCEVTIGKNLEIQLDDSAFDSSTGHWLPGNNGTIITTVPASTYGTTPPHTSYDPIPASSALITEGYLPVNNENVGLFTSATSFAWSQLLPSVSPPVARQFASTAFDTATGIVLLFGGHDGTVRNDTWAWNGTIWNQLSPTVSPPARYQASMVYHAATTSIILFGGLDVGGNALGDMWSWNGTTWTELFPTTLPPARSNAPMAYDANTTATILFGGNGAGASLLNDTWSWNGTTWTQVPISPPARDGAMMAYDTNTSTIILFGGQSVVGSTQLLNDTWSWNGSVWTQLAPATSPTARIGGGMVYDTARTQIVLFGGQNASGTLLADTWTWNGTTWALKAPATSPPARYLTQMAYDTSTSSTVLFGGATTSGALADTWTWNGTTWTQVFPATSPTARGGGAMTYHAANSTVVLFGGGGNLNDTWTWNGTTWTQKSPATVPEGRYQGALVYDTASSTSILFGGVDQSVSTILNDTWAWNGTNWAQAFPSTSPPVRFTPAMAYDTATSTIVLFGGGSYTVALNDTWTWNGTTWSNPTVSPPARAGASMDYDTATTTIIMFGGLGSSGLLNDTWKWNGTGWAQIALITNPTARENAAMHYDTATSTIILFGGLGGSGPQALNDTWSWNGTIWTALTPATSPTARYGAAISYDSLSSTIILFGGFGVSGSLGETWSWNGTTWTHLAATLYPPVRYGAGVAYDAAHSVVVLFGGMGIAGPLNDTWTWNGTTWTELFPVTVPTAVYNPIMIYDPATTTTVLFGGVQASGTPSNATLSWNGTNWSVLAPAHVPTARSAAAVFYNPVSSAIIMFGGLGAGNTILSDTVTWSGTNWVQITPTTVPPARYGATAAYDTALGNGVMFGGTGASGALGDTWTYTTAGGWVQPSVAASPPARAGASSVYESATGSVLVFGGSSSSGVVLSDTWSWNGVTWIQLTVAGGPYPRTLPAAVFDTASNSVVLFGGLVGSNFLGDTWSSSFTSFPVFLSTCTPATAQTLGIPVTAGQTVVLSAYFSPIPQATPVLRSFFVQIDWYDQNGSPLSSTIGATITEIAGQWVRAYSAGKPPNGAATYGRTIKSVVSLSGDLHMLDAEQVELNTQATPGPTSWEPPRDIKINLLPIRQNLFTNPLGLGGSNGWTITGGTFQNSNALISPPSITWPADTLSGLVLTASSTANIVLSTTIPVNGGLSYSLSAYAQAAAATNRTVQLAVQYQTSNGTPISTTTISFAEAAAFPRGSNINQIAPETAAKALVSITVVAPVANEVHYIGAPLFEPLSYLLPYFDANFSPFSDYLFEGIPNQSVSDYYPALPAKLSRLSVVMEEYVPIGSTYSLITGAQALSNAGLVG